MASFNKVFIMGNLGQDPELRYTQSQTPVATMNVATTDVWMKEGQRQEQTEWHRVVVWNRQAENCAKYLSKGRSVLVEGKVQTRAWEDKNGQKRYTTEINASSVQFLPNSTGQGGGMRAEGSMGDSSGFAPEQFPPAEGTSGAQGSSQSSPSDLDDIPF